MRNSLFGRKAHSSFASVIACIVLGSCTPSFWEGATDGLEDYNQSAYGAASSETVCIKYQTSTGWSKGYQVDGPVIQGSELNRRTNTYDYKPYSTYVVVFWNPNQASILELDYFLGSINSFGQLATDQIDRRWQVSKTSYCY